MKTLNDDTFLDAISNGISMIKFTAAWCSPCQALGPVLEKVEASTGVPVYEVDIDENQKLVELFGIKAVPTVIMFKDGTFVGNPQVGVRSLNTYVELVDQIKNSTN